jgi:hypothetical protein
LFLSENVVGGGGGGGVGVCMCGPEIGKQILKYK